MSEVAISITMRVRIVIAVLIVLAALSGCRRDAPEPSQNSAAPTAIPANSSVDNSAKNISSSEKNVVQFVDITRAAGISFKHNNGAFGLRLAPENMGSGAAFFDYDNDGFPDIFLVNGRDWSDSELAEYRNHNGREHVKRYNFKIPARRTIRRSGGALYHNNGDGTFRDVTANSGLNIEIQGMGVAAGDYDNDGRTDLYVTAYPRNYLFHNEGEGKFREVAAQSGVRNSGWSSSAAWLDYDKDGQLDLFVGRYYQWNPAIDAYKDYKGQKAYSAPEQYRPQCSQLYRNLGKGRFVDVSQKAGICSEAASNAETSLKSKTLGVAICDYDNDSWPDIAVANDRQRNFLFHNNGKGAFTEVGMRANIALSDSGQERAGMGIDAGDIDHSNRESLLITNFSGETVNLYQNMANGLFRDIAPASEVGRVSLPFLSFGALFVDTDNDGWLDIMIANGHVNDIDLKLALQPPLLFHNLGKLPQNLMNSTKITDFVPQFRSIGLESGAPLSEPMMGRGLASADIDLDGDVDILITTNGGPAHLLRNDGGNRGKAIRVVLKGSKSNRDAIGALVWAEIGSDLVRRRVRSGSSYLSQSELPVALGLGNAPNATIVVRWPSGKLMNFPKIAANQTITIDENKGIVKRQPLAR